MNMLNIGRNAMIAHSKAMEITSNNITNAYNEGYSRQSVSFEDTNGLGGIGKVNVRRIVNNQHVENMQTQKSLHSKNSSYLFNMTNLNNKLTNSNFNFNNVMNNVFTSFREATAISENTGAKNNVLRNLKDFNQYMKLQDQNLKQEDSEIDQQIKNKLLEANNYINNISNLNKIIIEQYKCYCYRS